LRDDGTEEGRCRTGAEVEGVLLALGREVRREWRSESAVRVREEGWEESGAREEETMEIACGRSSVSRSASRRA
jgi:hypothetical protein